MKSITTFALALCLFVSLSTPASAQLVTVESGRTNVALDFETLAAAASLELSSVSGDVIVPGNIPELPGGPSVAFPITPATDFTYDPADFLGTFSGEITHIGSVLFNTDTVEVGNFTIGFDAARAGTLPDGSGTGFFVESTIGVAAILFDVTNLGPVNPTAKILEVGGDLAVSPEFGSFLFDNQLSTANLEGAVVGNALIEGVVPEPGTSTLLLLSLFGTMVIRRRN